MPTPTLSDPAPPRPYLRSDYLPMRNPLFLRATRVAVVLLLLVLVAVAYADESAVEIDPDADQGNCKPGKKCSASAGTAPDDDTDQVVEDKVVDSDDADQADDDVQVDDDDDQDTADEDEDEEEKEDKPAVIDPEGSEGDDSYELPADSGATFFDSFQAKSLDQWVYTEADGYNGQFAVGQGREPTLKGDRALIIPNKARKYGISAAFDGMTDMSTQTLVVQYEFKVEEGHTCGGAYVKLPLPGFESKKLDGETPYSVMFGPDKCGSTDKVHFIFQSKHPETGKRREHHLKKAPSLPIGSTDGTTHLYTLIVHASNDFEVRIDGQVKANGTLKDSFNPPVQMPLKIPDPDDKKPKDWVDAKKIPDPDATKPEDWDEDAPKTLVDEEAKKPDGWLDDEPTEVPDPEAKKPEEWDDDEDGVWEAAKVPNPKCEAVGCGEWKRPMKANPDYKGKWKAPMMDNPKYVGEWKPREIDNPDYYKVEEIRLLPVGGIALELWTMDQGVLFDNIWVGDDVGKAERFAKETFEVKKQKDDEKAKKREEEEKASQEADGDGDDDSDDNDDAEDEADDDAEDDAEGDAESGADDDESSSGEKDEL